MLTRVGLAQIDPTVADLEGNVRLCAEAAVEAAAGGAELVVLPELAIPGYPPRDILYDPTFVDAVTEATSDLARRVADLPPVVVGTIGRLGAPLTRHPRLLNIAALLAGGAIRATVAKRLLPPDDVFFEPRWFVPGGPSRPLELAGARVGLLVCADLWDEGDEVRPAAELRAAGAELLVAPHASPYRRRVLERRLAHARAAGLPVAVVNAVGGQDELVFDGSSFVLNGGGELLAKLAAFAPEVRVVDLEADPVPPPPPPEPEAELFSALVLGVRDFARKNRLRRAVVGLSGGIDSAVVAAIAATALGPENLLAVALPSRYSDPRSTESAEALAHSLGTRFEIVPLEPLHRAAEQTLARVLDRGTSAENVQARLRMVVLMAFVNRHGGMLVNTSNKTELALGYSTLYGDLAGALCPLGDVTKPEVVALARWIDGNRCSIPSFTLERPPSAELRPGQVDPFDYDAVAPAIEELVRANRSDVSLRRSEHKRWQAGVVLKVSDKAFGSGRMIPITRA